MGIEQGLGWLGLGCLLLGGSLAVGCDTSPASETDAGAGGAAALDVSLPPVVDASSGIVNLGDGSGGGASGGGSGGGASGGGQSGGAPAGGDRGPLPCEATGDEICYNDLDDDCDGDVDEGCPCREPEKPCYTGNPADLASAESACRPGTQACQLELYGPCEGEVLPSIEVCDGQDNDCDGIADEALDCADNTPPEAICPPDQVGSPLADYRLEGGYEDADGDAMVRAEWTITERPAGSTAIPMPPDELSSQLFADLQGTYVIQLEVEDARGGVGTCTTRVIASSNDRIRVEMVWNVGEAGDRSDVDLHLLKSPDGRWFDGGPTGDDCFYRNCRICDRGLGEAECRQQIADYNIDPDSVPPPQVEWFPPLDDDDPRLDLDDVDGNGPENVNIHDPREGTYRLGVHYYDDEGHGPSTVSVRIFCAGALAQAFEPLILQSPDSNGGPDTEFWEVADIVWQAGGCEVRPFGSPGCRQICSRAEAEAGGCPAGLQRGRPCN